MSDKEEASQPAEEAQAATTEATSSEKPNETSIHIGNLPYSVTEAKLKEMFQECGEVINARVPINERGQSKGYGFVAMKKEDADKAIEKLNNKEIDGRLIKVELSIPRRERPRRDDFERRDRRRYDDDDDYYRRRRYDDYDRERRDRRRYDDYDRDRRYDDRYDRYDRDRRRDRY